MHIYSINNKILNITMKCIYLKCNRFGEMNSERLVFNIYGVEIYVIQTGMLFQIMAPAYWRIRLNNSFLCFFGFVFHFLSWNTHVLFFDEAKAIR